MLGLMKSIRVAIESGAKCMKMAVLSVMAVSCSLAPLVTSADEVTITHDGLTLNANLVPASADLANGVILMLHGTLGHKYMEIMATMQSVFAENNRTTLAINLSLDVDNRHGFYPCDRAHTHRLDDANAELAAWVNWLEANGAGEVVLFGHSRGANQVARYVVEASPDVKAAILVAPSIAEEKFSVEQKSNVKLATDGERLVDVNFLHCTNSAVSSDSYLSYYGSPAIADTPAMLSGFVIPAIVFSGSEDTVVKDLGKHMRVIHNDLVKHIEIDGADHFFRDLYTYDVVEQAEEFLNAL